MAAPRLGSVLQTAGLLAVSLVMWAQNAAVIDHTYAPTTGGGSMTTAAINPTGANYYVVAIASGGHNCPATVPFTDSTGANTYSPLKIAGVQVCSVDTQANVAGSVWYAPRLDTSSSVTFTTTEVAIYATAVSNYYAIDASTISASQPSPGGSSVSTGPFTPQQNHELILNFLFENNTGGTGSVAATSPMVLLDGNISGSFYTGASSSFVQPTAATISPTYTQTAFGCCISTIGFGVASTGSPLALQFTSSALPAAYNQGSYTYDLPIEYGTGPYTCNVSAGSLPAGVTLTSSGGNTNCTLTATAVPAGPLTQNVTLKVTDSAAATAFTSGSQFVVAAPPAPGLQFVSSTRTPVSPLPDVGACSPFYGTAMTPCSNLNGWTPFPSTNAWNTNIAAASVDPNSGTILSGITSFLHHDFGNFSFQGGYGIPWSVVDSSLTSTFIPMRIATVTERPTDEPTLGDQSDQLYTPAQILTTPIELGQTIGTGCSTPGGPLTYLGDTHLLVLDRNTGFLYESYPTWRCGNAPANYEYIAAQTTIWDTKTAIAYPQRPYGWTSADAAGLSVFAGLVKYSEVAACVANPTLNPITHAFRMTLAVTKSNPNGGFFVSPASHASGNGGGANVIGMRLRLKSSFNISGFSAVNQCLLTALQQYGGIIADNGGNTFISGDNDVRWDDTDLQNINNIKVCTSFPSNCNFEVVQTAPTYPGYDSGTAPNGIWLPNFAYILGQQIADWTGAQYTSNGPVWQVTTAGTSNGVSDPFPSNPTTCNASLSGVTTVTDGTVVWGCYAHSAVPVINSYSVNHTTIAFGSSVTFTYSTTGSNYDFVDNAGPVAQGGGTITITPSATNTYILNSTNQYGRVVSSPITVTVTGSSPTAGVTVSGKVTFTGKVSMN